jgi:hypothetical protein
MRILTKIFGQPMQIVVAHAARPREEIDLSDEGELSPFITVTSPDGPLGDGYFVVKASGNSMVPQGITDGTRLLAKRVNADIVGQIDHGAIVIVSDPVSNSNTPRCFRVFDRLNGNVAHFAADGGGLHAPLKVDNVLGVVTHRVATR